MAVHTSLGFIVIGGGLTLLALRPTNEVGNNWWPAAAAITVVVFSISLAQAINAQEKEVFALMNREGVHFDVLVLVFGGVLSLTVYMTLRLMQKEKSRSAELLSLTRKLEELSVTDHLTKLYNRLKIDEALNNENPR